MSTIRVEVLRVDEVTSHPNADKLAVLHIGGVTTCRDKGAIQAGDSVVYFPPGILLGAGVGERLGVKNYLRNAVYPGTLESSACRVGAARLRGVPSFGFASTLEEAFGTPEIEGLVGDVQYPEVGTDVGSYFGAVKYEPPVKLSGCETDVDHPLFHGYTDI